MEAFYIIVLVAAVGGAILKYFRTKELSSKLGREVEDHELVSLNSWIEAENNAEQKRSAFKRKVVKYEGADEKGLAAPPDTGTKQAVAVKYHQTQPDDKPANCPHCGAILSKELAYCAFCNSHLSQRDVEQHCAVFLFDLQEDLLTHTPGSHRLLATGRWLVPILVFFGLISSNIFAGAGLGLCTMLFVAFGIATIIGMTWGWLSEKHLMKTDSANFDHLYQPKIKQFISRHALKPIEFLSIARCHLEKESRLLKQIHRHF